MVLGISLDFDKNGLVRRYTNFLVKRFFRIYPAYWTCLIAVCLTLTFFKVSNPNGFEGLSAWYNDFYRIQPVEEQVLWSITLLKSYIIPIAWTLVVEMMVALVFPLLHACSRLPGNYGYLLNIFLLLTLIVLSRVETYGPVPNHIYKFYLGLLIPIYGH